MQQELIDGKKNLQTENLSDTGKHAMQLEIESLTETKAANARNKSSNNGMGQQENQTKSNYDSIFQLTNTDLKQKHAIQLQ